MNMASKRKGKEIVAERTLTTKSSSEPVTLTVERPTHDGDDWACKFSVLGAGIEIREVAYGLDSVQALLLAFEGARRLIDGLPLALAWAGDPNHCGLPRCVPLFYGAEFAARLERVVDREIERFAVSAQQGRNGKKA
jgi:hypothetical protein